MSEPETNNTLNNPTAAQPDSDARPAALPENDLAADLAVAKAETAANYDKFMRAAADLENFRRRAVREKDELRQIVTGRVVEDILPVLDNLALGLAAAKQPNADLKSLVG